MLVTLHRGNIYAVIIVNREAVVKGGVSGSHSASCAVVQLHIFRVKFTALRLRYSLQRAEAVVMATVNKIVDTLAPTVRLVHHEIAFVCLRRVVEPLRIGLRAVVITAAIGIVERTNKHFAGRYIFSHYAVTLRHDSGDVRRRFESVVVVVARFVIEV